MFRPVGNGQVQPKLAEQSPRRLQPAGGGKTCTFSIRAAALYASSRVLGPGSLRGVSSPWVRK